VVRFTDAFVVCAYFVLTRPFSYSSNLFREREMTVDPVDDAFDCGRHGEGGEGAGEGGRERERERALDYILATFIYILYI
jgi:hypothetical protein